ncbi:hypothetical protein PHMEG_00013249 [Phytophthora megakarya]|uniref:Uncharacterized protein n=1 Tax=Phytophthora megakarya TaxID=4795 RepID=A0A225W6S6_9STRA|nr:hypothetical protein PHMEG_00013249 [Phytophthora megakarya]
MGTREKTASVRIISVTADIKQDFLWWWFVLHASQLNGVSPEDFNTLLLPSVVVEVDVSECGLYALDVCDINFYEILSFTFAVNEWSQRWPSYASHGCRPVHIHFQKTTHPPLRDIA